MISLPEYQRLQAAVESKQREADRAAGAEEQLTAKLKDDHGCGSLEEAKTLLRKLEKRAEREEAEFERALEKFREDHPEVME